MKEGYVISKSEVVGLGEDLSKINLFTRKEMSENEIYTFSILLCDNETDRDNERFSINALYELSKLFVGKTGIFDHQMSAENQSARIYDCYVEADESKKTQAGEIYYKLMAKAYMPRTAKNADFITEIESGIKKEVSVGCSVSKIICSVCGKDMRTHNCEHIKGKQYRVNGKDEIAHAVLDCPTDAYEWSFVAVPAQRNAGVVKRFETEKQNAVINKISNCDADVTLSKIEVIKINSLIDSYYEKCEEVDECKGAIKKEVLLLLKGEVKEEMLKKFSLLCDRLTSKELIDFKENIKKEICVENSEIRSQLISQKKKHKSSKNQGFII